MATQYIYDMTDTWNDAGTLDGIKMVITNTLSGAASNILNLSIVSGASIVVSKDGVLTINDGSNSLAFSPVVATTRTNLGLTALATTTPGTGIATFLTTPSSANLLAAVTDETGTGALVFGTTPTFTTSALFPAGTAAAPGIAWSADADGSGTGFFRRGANEIGVAINGVERMYFNDLGVTTNYCTVQQYVNNSGNYLCRSNTATVGHFWGTSDDVFLGRDAADTLALRRTTNGQTINLYNTYTSLTDCELYRAGWSSNVCYTGVRPGSGGGTKRLQVFDGAAEKALTDNTATAFVQIPVASGAGVGGSIDYVIFATDGTDHQTSAGSVNFSAVNKGGTETCTLGTINNEAKAVSAGTLTHTFDADTSPTNAVNLRVTADTSLTTTTFVIRYRVNILGPAVVVVPQ